MTLVGMVLIGLVKESNRHQVIGEMETYYAEELLKFQQQAVDYGYGTWMGDQTWPTRRFFWIPPEKPVQPQPFITTLNRQPDKEADEQEP